MSMSDATRAKLSAAQRRRWAADHDGMRARIEEGLVYARYKKPPKGSKQKGGKRGVFVVCEPEVLAALAALKLKTGKSVNEIVRTYIAWGLENDGVEP